MSLILYSEHESYLSFCLLVVTCDWLPVSPAILRVRLCNKSLKKRKEKKKKRVNLNKFNGKNDSNTKIKIKFYLRSAQCVSERMQNRRLRNGQTFTGPRAFSRQNVFPFF